MQPLLAGVNLLLEMSQCGPGRTSCQLAPPWTIGSAAHISSLLPVTSADDDATTAVAFRLVAVPEANATLTCVAQDGTVLWSRVYATRGENVSMTGGFDFDGDGFPDVALSHVVNDSSGASCGHFPMQRSFFSLVRGKTGDPVELVGLPASEERDTCWDFREPSNPVQVRQCNLTQHCVYPTTQWLSGEMPMWGADTGTLALSPTYSQYGYFFKWDETASLMRLSGKFKFPSCPMASDNLHCAAAATEPFATYDKAELSAYAALEGTASFGGGCANHKQWTKCTVNPHTANGVIVKGGNTEATQERLAFFTSSRAVNFAVSRDFSPSQLLGDAPFLTNNRTDIVGRNYGLVEQDPAFPGRVAGVFGTSISNVLIDLLHNRDTCNVSEGAGSLAGQWADCQDSWGGIERHVSLYDTDTNTVVDRFFSLAHDPKLPLDEVFLGMCESLLSPPPQPDWSWQDPSTALPTSIASLRSHIALTLR